MASFDTIAPLYDELWTTTAVGDMQRHAVWNSIDPLFRQGESVLDLGCGTGVDAVHLRQKGVQVYGIDSSQEMVRIAKSRAVDAHLCHLENLSELDRRFDGAISNFGALNCIPLLSPVASELARLVRSGGYVALCFIGRVCLWELGYYSIRGNIKKAVRRLSGQANSSYGVKVVYPTRGTVVRAFRERFILCAHVGVGLTVPPSYVTWLSVPMLEKLNAVDERLVARPLLRSLSDHQLYIWRRL